MKLEGELRHALDRQELEVFFQPVVRAEDGHVCGLEALLRWTHPWLGVVRPDRFIPVAEDSGLIVDIGAWVLDQACAEVAQLRRLLPGSDHLYVAVNLSARQLRDDRLRRPRRPTCSTATACRPIPCAWSSPSPC